jgi:lipooligosaccharide transport system permease protein
MNDMRIIHIKSKPPELWTRLFSVWYRHFRVYTRNIISNGFPAFIEPLIFLVAIGIGLGMFVESINGIPYITFLASAIVVPTAMYTAAFECTFGTFIRLEFDKVYDGMLASSITINDLFTGEIIFAGTKGCFFSAIVLFVITLFGIPLNIEPEYTAIFIPVVGLLTGFMFGAFSLYVTSFVDTINHFNFYFTGFLTPLFFFSGIVFPLDHLPDILQIVSEILPLVHSVEIVRSLYFNTYKIRLIYDLIYILLYTIIFAYFALKRLEKRLIQ